jgi:hypothetical protein
MAIMSPVSRGFHRKRQDPAENAALPQALVQSGHRAERMKTERFGGHGRNLMETVDGNAIGGRRRFAS